MLRTIFATVLGIMSATVFAQAGTWNGNYGGLSVGGRWVDADWRTKAVAGFGVDTTTFKDSYDSSAARVGGFLGRNWQIAPDWLAGVEASLGYGDNKETGRGIPGTHGPIIVSPTPAALANDKTWVRATWDASLRGRIGTLVNPSTLIYLAGGLATQRLDIGASCTGIAGWCVAARSKTSSSWRSGWTLGGGAEWGAGKDWRWRAEYSYANLGSKGVTFFPGTVDAVTADVKVRTHTAFIGFVYRFK